MALKASARLNGSKGRDGRLLQHIKVALALQRGPGGVCEAPCEACEAAFQSGRKWVAPRRMLATHLPEGVLDCEDLLARDAAPPLHHNSGRSPHLRLGIVGLLRDDSQRPQIEQQGLGARAEIGGVFTSVDGKSRVSVPEHTPAAEALPLPCSGAS